jgi:hypothetical protein
VVAAVGVDATGAVVLAVVVDATGGVVVTTGFVVSDLPQPVKTMMIASIVAKVTQINFFIFPPLY